MRATPRRAAAATSLVLVAGLLSAQASWADPDVGADDVADARAAVTSAAGAVADIELQLAVQSAALDAAWTAVQAAGEDYTEAIVVRDVAAATGVEAAARAEAALDDVEVARAALGQIALEAYRSGGSLDGLSAFLSADGYEDLVARSTAIENLGDRAQRAVQRLEAAELVSRTLGGRAEEAAAAATAGAAAAEDALAAAQAAQGAAEEQVTAIAAQREALLVELAQRRQTSVEVERARQATLDAERAARLEAAAAATRGVPRGAPSNPATPPVTNPPVPPVTNPATPPVTNPPVPPVTNPPVPPVTNPPVPPVTNQPVPPVTNPPAPAPPSSDPYGLGTGSQRGSAEQGQAAVTWAGAQVGKPYSYGASGLDSFDCSGLTSQAWRDAGVSINRTSRDQYRQVRKIAYDSLRPGDLIFYGSVGSDPGSITHVAMYVGGGQMVEAPRPGVALRVATIRWSGTMPYAGRP